MIDHLLIATLGTSWPVIPEVYGIFTGCYGHIPVLDLPKAPDAVWIISTRHAWSSQHEPLERWADLVGVELNASLLDSDDLESHADVLAMRELIFRVVLAASESSRELSCSLAGGRKTMSADMQEAASIFGCRRLLHILANGAPKSWPAPLNAPDPETFIQPLPEHCRGILLPVVLPGHRRADLLDVAWRSRPPITGAQFLPNGPPAPRLSEEIAARRADSGLLSNFIANIENDEHHENWRSLYRLPPRLISRLRETPIRPEHEPLLRLLPKADLHRHIGGILDLHQQRRVAEAIWADSNLAQRQAAHARIDAIDQAAWFAPEAAWRRALKEGDRTLNTAAVFQLFDDQQLQSILFPPGELRLGLKHRSPLGFAAYERPGELSGSAVLSHPAALEATVQALLDNCRAEGLAYLELRGSPHKYADDPIAWLRRLHDTITARHSDTVIRFLWIVDRRHKNGIHELIRTIVSARERIPDFLVGLDLAGDEKEGKASELAEHFTPAFAACLPITIHAGEGEHAANIWQAAYHLHADRIGHGLTLPEDPALLGRFRDRGICLECCPTSNREVVGYHDPAWPESTGYPRHPLIDLWRSGVPLCVCTDNPGISRCTLHGEYLAIGRMLPDLTLWDALAMIKRGFIHAFADAGLRASMLKRVDHRIGEIIAAHFTEIA